MPPPGRGGRLEGGRPAILPSFLFFFSCSSSCNYFSFSCSRARYWRAAIPAPGRAMSHAHTQTHTRARAHSGRTFPSFPPDREPVPFPRSLSRREAEVGALLLLGAGAPTQNRSSIFRSNRCRGWGRAKPTSERSNSKAERERERERFETMGNVKSKRGLEERADELLQGLHGPRKGEEVRSDPRPTGVVGREPFLGFADALSLTLSVLPPPPPRSGTTAGITIATPATAGPVPASGSIRNSRTAATRAWTARWV